MRWPFVSRAAYEAAVARSEKRIAERDAELMDAARRYDDSVGFLQARCSDWAARYDKLLNKYHALRVKGANVAPERPPATPAPELPISVQTAIEEFAEGNSGVRRHLHERAWLHLNAGKAESWICQRIREGDSA